MITISTTENPKGPFQPGGFELVLPSGTIQRVWTDRVETARHVALLFNEKMKECYPAYTVVVDGGGCLILRIDYEMILGDFFVALPHDVLVNPLLQWYMDAKTITARRMDYRIRYTPLEVFGGLKTREMFGMIVNTIPTPSNIVATLTAPGLPLFNVFYP